MPNNYFQRPKLNVVGSHTFTPNRQTLSYTHLASTKTQLNRLTCVIAAGKFAFFRCSRLQQGFVPCKIDKPERREFNKARACGNRFICVAIFASISTHDGGQFAGLGRVRTDNFQRPLFMSEIHSKYSHTRMTGDDGTNLLIDEIGCFQTFFNHFL